MTKRNPSSLERVSRLSLLVTLMLGIVHVPTLAGQTVEDKVEALTHQVAQLSELILELRSETRELRRELQRTRDPESTGSASTLDLEARALALPEPDPSRQQQGALTPNEPNVKSEDRILALEEEQRLLADQLKEQYQTKVESVSRYRTKLSGVILLNAFSNRGRVDNQEVPDLALRRGSADPAGTFGFTGLQSQLGFETYGPEWAGGRVSAGLQADFFGVSPSSPYASSWGAVRLRTATVRVDWARTSVIVGQDAPFISPLSPASVASLAYPAFSYSGNLWNWIPQARVEHRLDLSERNAISIQGGIFEPATRGSQQPGYGTRLALSHGDRDRPLVLGIGTYYGRQNRGAGRTTDGWAGTADWVIPMGNRFEVAGEFYRGRALGNLGAAQGRSVLFDGVESDPASSMIGLNSTGGWAQLTFKASRSVELHAAQGEDHPYRRDLLRFTPAAGPSSAISRNRTGMFNVIYRPRTDLLFSAEYRRFKTSRLGATRDTSDHFNLGVGVLF